MAVGDKKFIVKRMAAVAAMVNKKKAKEFYLAGKNKERSPPRKLVGSIESQGHVV